MEGKMMQACALLEPAAWSQEHHCSQGQCCEQAEAKNLERNQNGEMHDTPKERCLYSRGCYLTRILKAENKHVRDRGLCEKPWCVHSSS